MGDNFYNDGVISTTDPQWFYSFENIYTAYHLHVPLYTVFGNHDYRGSIQAQLDYSKISRRWSTNARYYSIEKNIPGSKDSVLFVFIDTNPFDQTLDRKQHSDLAQQDTLQQKNWLENVLKNSKAKWKIAIGHHPLFTTGVRKGTMLDVRRSYVSLFEKYKVDAYCLRSEMKKNKDLTVVLTGGDANFLSNRLKNGIFANPNFLLEGLNTILTYNL